MANNEVVPKWLIGMILVVAGAMAYIGEKAVSNTIGIDAACKLLEDHKKTQADQFQDIKEWLLRIDAKIDKLGDRYEKLHFTDGSKEFDTLDILNSNGFGVDLDIPDVPPRVQSRK